MRPRPRRSTRARAVHPLEAELSQRAAKDKRIFSFIESVVLDGVWYWDLAHPSETWMSPSLKTHLGYTVEEVPNKTEWLRKQILPSDLELAVAALKRLTGNPSIPFDQLLRFRHKDGSLIWIRCRARLLDGDGDQPARVLGTHTDLTAFMRAKDRIAALDDEVSFGRSVVTSAPVAMMVVDTGGRIRFANQRAETLFGYSRIELLERPFESLLAPKSRPSSPLLRPNPLDLTGNAPPGLDVETSLDTPPELWGRRKDGAEIAIELGVSPLGHAEGERHLVAIMDVSYRAKAALELRVSEQRFRVLAESLPLMLWTCNADGYCDYLSPQWCAYTGVDEASQLGHGWARQLHPDDRAITFNRWEIAMASELDFATEFRIRGRDGQYRWFMCRARPVRDTAGKIVKWFGTNSDVQDLRDATDELTRLNQELEARVASRTREITTANLRLEQLAHQLTEVHRSVGLALWTYDVETDHMEWAPGFHELMGLDPNSPIPSPAERRKLLTQASTDLVLDVFERCIRTGEPYSVELEVARPAARARHILARGQALRRPDGTIHRIVGSVKDITDIILARRAIEASREGAG